MLDINMMNTSNADFIIYNVLLYYASNLYVIIQDGEGFF